MTTHIRFNQAFASYEKGKAYHLPPELADMYLKAGVAVQVDYVPQKAEAHDPFAVPEAARHADEFKPLKRAKLKPKVSDADDVSTAADRE